MQIKVELGANKGFFAQCILKYCQKTQKKCNLVNIWYDDYESILKCIFEKNLC